MFLGMTFLSTITGIRVGSEMPLFKSIISLEWSPTMYFALHDLDKLMHKSFIPRSNEMCVSIRFLVRPKLFNESGI